MGVYGISRCPPFGKRCDVIFGELQGACNSRINVVALLKIDVLKEIATHRPSRNRVAVHVDPGQLRNCTLYRHQPLAQVLVNVDF